MSLGDGRTGGAGSAGAAGSASDGGSAGAAGSPGSGGSAGEAGTGGDEPPFGEPVPIDDLAPSEGKLDDPSLTADRMELYFNVDFPDDDTQSEDIWAAVRTSAGEDWAEGAPVAELNTEFRETGIAMAPDGLTLWFSSDRDTDENLDVYVTTRPTRQDPWETPQRVDTLSTDADDLVSGISSDELTLVLALRETSDDDYDIYYSTRSSKTATFPAAVPFEGDLNTDEKDSDASYIGDGRRLLFTRGGDLIVAARPSTSAPFASDGEHVLTELNSSEDERDAWASDAFDYVIFSSNRTGSYILYEAYR